MSDMRIGVDFDNTIVCFDPLFRSAALEKKLIPKNAAASKAGVREWLRSKDNNEWTRLQGHVYGRLICRAKPFPGVKTFFSRAARQGHSVFIISHKTKKSALPPFLDLHAPARAWLRKQGFSERAFFETSQQRKLWRLKKLKCEFMIDDLTEFLARPDFPKNVKRILFDPHKHHRSGRFDRVSSWGQAARRLLS